MKIALAEVNLKNTAVKFDKQREQLITAKKTIQMRC